MSGRKEQLEQRPGCAWCVPGAASPGLGWGEGSTDQVGTCKAGFYPE